MFGFDFPEVVIIFGIALVVLGPKKLPGTAAQIGRWVGRARAMARQFREQLEQEVNSVESALDANATPPPAAKPPPSASSTAPASVSSAPAETVPAPGAAEPPVEDPAAPGFDWRPEYGDFPGFPAPYGDPDAIPEPESSDGQLSLQLDLPPAAAPAAPRTAAPPTGAPPTAATHAAAADNPAESHAPAGTVSAGPDESR